MRPSHSAHVLTSQIEILSSLFLRHRKQQQAFALWRRPGSIEKHFLVCTQSVTEISEFLIEDSSPGFVFAPFDTTKNKFFLTADRVYSFSDRDPLEHKFTQNEFTELTTAFSAEE